MKSSSGFFILIAFMSLTLSAQLLPIRSITSEVKSEPKITTEAEVKTEGEVKVKSDLFFICKKEREMRWLRAFKTDNIHCKTYYAKEGYVQTVSSASNFATCESMLNAVKKNLEDGGFLCKEKILSSMVELN